MAVLWREMEIQEPGGRWSGKASQEGDIGAKACRSRRGLADSWGRAFRQSRETAVPLEGGELGKVGRWVRRDNGGLAGHSENLGFY